MKRICSSTLSTLRSNRPSAVAIRRSLVARSTGRTPAIAAAATCVRASISNTGKGAVSSSPRRVGERA